MAAATGEARDRALEAIATELERAEQDVLRANADDVSRAKDMHTPAAMIDRLALDRGRFAGMVRSVREVKAQGDPLGEERAMGVRPNGMRVAKRRIPLGVLAVV